MVSFWNKIDINLNDKNSKKTEILSINNNENKSKNILNNLLENIPAYVYWKNKEGIFEGCNDLLANLAGYENAKDLIGKTDYEVTSKEEADKIRAHDELVKRGLRGIVVEEIGYYPNTQKKMYALSYKAPLFDENKNVIGIIGISIDITEKKHLEEELNNKNQELESLLNNVLAKYKNFVLNQEHDIRTPVANVEGLAAALIEQLKDPADLELANLIYQSAKAQHAYQNTMVDSIYLFNEKTENYRRRFQIKNVIEQVIAIFACSFHEEKLNFSLELSQSLPKFLWGDWFRLQQILVCLLSNAVKFTNSNGNIWLRCVPEFKSERQIVLIVDVEDTGIGISNDQLNTIFEPFVRLTLSNIGKYEGRGLGLTFVKKMVDDLDGEIDVTSVLGKGSLFRLLLPYNVSLSSEQLPSICSAR